ncbi:hypothetical protein JW905_03810 [bacterium]|nr:hypothetical protein [candidate division CSSED10-310 bacterium]
MKDTQDRHFTLQASLNRHFRPIVAVLLCLFASSGPCAGAQDISLSASLDRQAVPLNQSFQLVVRLEWRGAADAFHCAPPHLESGDQLHVVQSATATSTSLQGGEPVSTITYRFTIRPLRQGVVGLPALAVRYGVDPADLNRVITAPPLDITVTAPVVSARLPMPWWLAMAVPAAGIGIAAGVLSARRRRRSRPAPEPAEQPADRLDTLRSLRDMEEVNEYVLAVGALVAAHLHALAGSSGVELNRGLLDKLPAGVLDDESRMELLVCMELVDQVKYAGRRPGGLEIDRVEAMARRMLRAGVSAEVKTNGS